MSESGVKLLLPEIAKYEEENSFLGFDLLLCSIPLLIVKSFLILGFETSRILQIDEWLKFLDT